MEMTSRLYEMVQACSDAIVAAVAVLALGVAWFTYVSAVRESNDKFAADTILEWTHDQPVNFRLCHHLLITDLTREDIQTIAKRQNLTLRTDLARQDFMACFSDTSKQDIPQIFDKSSNTVTPRGVSMLAERINEELNADNLVAAFLMQGIGNQALLGPIGSIVCGDKPILGELPDNEADITNSFWSVREFVKSCH